jgi:hypothetical protein
MSTMVCLGDERARQREAAMREWLSFRAVTLTLVRGVVAGVLLISQSGLVGAQEPAMTAIDELLEIMSDRESLELKKVTELPTRLQGRLLAIAEFDENAEKWRPMGGPQEFGKVAADRINVLGYEVGQDGFVEARYLELADRQVVSYTGITADRRLSVNLYDDESDTEHLVLQVRIGPRLFKYLLLRPSRDSK